MKNKIVVIGVFIGILSIGCASNKNQNPPNIDMDAIEQQQPIPAGSVEVKLAFVSFEGELAQVEVIEVMGYGSSTNRLAPSQSLEVMVHETLTEDFSSMESGMEFEAILSMQAAGVNMAPSWTITKILDR